MSQKEKPAFLFQDAGFFNARAFRYKLQPLRYSWWT